MASWLIPALRAILPHVGDIVSAAKPVFTRKPSSPAADPDTVSQQIAELQSAAAQNAANIHELAQQLERTVAALQQAGAVAESRLRRAVLLCAAAMSIAVVSLFVALFALATR